MLSLVPEMCDLFHNFLPLVSHLAHIFAYVQFFSFYIQSALRVVASVMVWTSLTALFARSRVNAVSRDRCQISKDAGNSLCLKNLSDGFMNLKPSL